MERDGSSGITDYRDLDVWKEAMNLAVAIYETTRGFPREEAFGMTAQMRRSATSVPANIAEGYGRERTQSFIQFLRIAQGSLKELETQVLLSERVGLIDGPAAEPLKLLCARVGKMLRAFVRALERKERAS